MLGCVAPLLLNEVEKVVVDISGCDNSLGAGLVDIFDGLDDCILDSQSNRINDSRTCELKELKE